MSWRQVYIRECENLAVKLDSLLIDKNGEEYKIPLEDINTIMLENNRSNITTKLLVRLSEYKISLIVCDDKMMPTGIMLPYNKQHRSSKIAYRQINLSQEEVDGIWTYIVKYKIHNQRENLIALNKDGVDKLGKYINEVKLGDINNREGHAAKVYFNCLFGKGFSRQFECTLNYALNYGYSIIRSSIARGISMAGLIPNIGIHHRSELNNFNLADDFIEVFRPVVDYVVATQIGDKDFLERADKIKLINILNGTIEVNKTRQTVSNAIEKFIYEFINTIETGEFKINIPLTATFKEYEL